MVKHTKIIRRQQPTNCLSVFDHFVGFAFKGLRRIPVTFNNKRYHLETVTREFSAKNNHSEKIRKIHRIVRGFFLESIVLFLISLQNKCQH